MIDNFLHWLGWYEAYFWPTPLGLILSSFLAFTAGVRVFRPRPRDHWADTLYFSCVALLFAMAFAAGLSDRIPHYVTKLLFCFYAVRAVWRSIEDWKRGEIL